MRQEKARGRDVTHMQTPFHRHLSHACNVHTHADVRMCADRLCNRQMCVQQVSVCTLPVVHTAVATTCVRNPKNSVEKILSMKKFNTHHSMTILTKKNSSIRRLGSEPLKNSQASSFHVRLDLSCWYLFHQLAFHQSL